MKIAFHGAAQEVTGLCIKVKIGKIRFLIDGGMLQGGREALLAWPGGSQRAPSRTFETHGEPRATAAPAPTITRQLGWNAETSELGQTVAVASDAGGRPQ